MASERHVIGWRRGEAQRAEAFKHQSNGADSGHRWCPEISASNGADSSRLDRNGSRWSSHVPLSSASEQARLNAGVGSGLSITVIKRSGSDVIPSLSLV